MEDTPKISLESLQSELKTIQLDFIRIKNDWITIEKRLNEKLFEIMQEAKDIKAAANKQQGRIGGYTVAELAKLKALGLLPKDLLTKPSLKEDGQTQKKDLHNALS